MSKQKGTKVIDATAEKTKMFDVKREEIDKIRHAAEEKRDREKKSLHQQVQEMGVDWGNFYNFLYNDKASISVSTLFDVVCPYYGLTLRKKRR